MTRHPLDAVSLIFGLVFTGLGTVTLWASHVPLQWLRSTVVVPLLLVAAGVALLAGSVGRARGRGVDEPPTAGS